MTDQFVFGYCGWAVLEDLYQTASLQQSHSTLYPGFRQAAPLRQVFEAQGDTFLFGTIQCGPEDDINQKSCWGVIVTSHIG